MNKKFVVAISTFVILFFVILPIIIFKLGLGKLLYALSFQENVIDNVRMINMIVMPILSIIFGILGYRLAKRKNRNPVVWVLLCGLFNVIGYLVLYNLKTFKKI